MKTTDLKTRWRTQRPFLLGLSINSVLLATLLALNAGCAIKANAVNIGQKTSLEKQLMGEVEPLTEEEMLASSVRSSSGGVQAGSRDDLQARAIAARRRQLFNRDDIDELKSAGCLGEALEAKLTARQCDPSTGSRQAEPSLLKLREQLITQENQDRKAIIDWAIGVDPILTPADRPQIVEIYHRLVLDKARPGDFVETAQGWSRH